MKKLFVLFFLIGCGKSTEVIRIMDTPPDLEVYYQNKPLTTERTEINLSRNQAELQPSLQTKLKESAPVDLRKTLACGQITLTSTNLSSLDFELSEKFFEGISDLPKRLACDLILTATNRNGSTHEHKLPILLIFPDFPKVEVSRISHNNSFPLPPDYNIVLDSVTITNNKRFPLRFKYSSQLAGQGQFRFSFTDPARRTQLFKDSESVPFVSTTIELSGDGDITTGDFRTFIDFTVQPSKTVSVKTKVGFEVPLNKFLLRNRNEEIFIDHEKTFFNVTSWSDGKTSLQLTLGFSQDDSGFEEFTQIKTNLYEGGSYGGG